MTATIGFTGGSGSTASININGSPVLTLDASGNLGGVASLNGGQLGGFRNKIINGSMVVAQRGTSFPAIANGTYALDRWRSNHSTDAVYTVAQFAAAPSNNEFQYSLSANVTTADTSIASNQFATFTQPVEGFNARDLIGRSFTLSFWVSSSKTGVHCVSLTNSGADRSYVAEYTVNAANTWETKTVTVPGGLITAGTWDWTNGVGLTVRFVMAAGFTYQTTKDAWQTGNFLATANQVNCLDTIGNIFAITGVQLEAGSVATPFETRSVGQELALCQRYYYRLTPNTGGGFGPCASATTNVNGYFLINFPVTMRTAPASLEQSGTASQYAIYVGTAGTAFSSVPTFNSSSPNTATLVYYATSGHTAGQAGSVYSNSGTPYLGFPAEL